MSLDEFSIIASYFAGHDRRGDVLLGVGDDAAVLDTGNDRKLVVAIDTIVEGVHFPSGCDAASVGHRALAVNLSDIAAMGAQPSWMTLSLSMPQVDEAWIGDFAAGLLRLAEEHEVALVGGDTVRGPRVVTVQLTGWVESDRWLTRAGASPGDVLMISGVPGEAAAGLDVVRQRLSGPAATHLRERFLRPQPRVALGRQLRLIASAAMDVSDGLLIDLQKLCRASGCGAQLNVDALPRSAATRELFGEEASIDYALAGGDDYELLFSLPPDQLAQLTAAHDPTLPLSKIGVITDSGGVQCMRGGAAFVPRRSGYDHFARDPAS